MNKVLKMFNYSATIRCGKKAFCLQDNLFIFRIGGSEREKNDICIQCTMHTSSATAEQLENSFVRSQSINFYCKHQKSASLPYLSDFLCISRGILSSNEARR
jgi:hypothetical protein